MTFRRWELRAVTLAMTLLSLVATARAATFSVTISNTTTFAWSTGLITFAPLLPLGATPTSGSGYTTYGYTTSACNVNANDDGDASALAGHLGLTLGTTAILVPAIAAGASTTVTFTATAGQKISYLADIYGAATEAEDDIVMLHAVGAPSNLAVPLFDVMGLPMSTIAFEVSGYDTNSTSAASGTAASCSPKCPTPTSGCYVAVNNGTTGGTLPAPAAQPTLTKTWAVTETGYTTDGIALGNLTSTSENQLIVLTEAGQYSSTYNPLGTGRAAVLTRTAGAVQSTFDATVVGHDFMGLPLIENLDGGTLSEYLVAEFSPLLPSPGASLYGRAGTSSTATWTSTGYGYPGFWNMGPMSADVRSDVNTTTPEIIEATYTGDIAVLNAMTGATVNSYSTYTALGETLYGHVAVGDVVGSTAPEIVGFGATSGKIFALNVPTGAGNVPMTVAWQGTAPTSIYAFGSGPAIGDLDKDGKAEIVVASAGTGKVYAFDPHSGSNTCKYQWTAPGGFDYAWSSPVIADVDGDGYKEVIVLSSDSVLSILGRATTASAACQDGVVKWTYTVGNGGPAWFTPAVANLTGSAVLDVVVANYDTLEVVNVATKSLAYRFVDSTAQFYPSAVIEGGGGGGAAQIYVSGWSNSKVYRLDTPTGAGVPAAWPAFMGGNTRTGAR